MPRPVTVSEAQDQLLETGFELYRIRQRIHHQFEALKAQYEPVREFYDAKEPPPDDEPRSLELEVAEQTDMAADQLEDVAEELLKAARLTHARIRQTWRVKQKERRP